MGRPNRIKPVGVVTVYHCVTRVVGGEFLLDDLGRTKMAQILARLSAFSEVKALTYCLMSNHVHLLLRVPAGVGLTDEALLARLQDFYGPEGKETRRAEDALRKRGAIEADHREKLLARMGDISAFMQEFKQAFSRWYNKRAGRFGTFWAERFSSTVVEELPEALRTVAGYVDLNPVRAGLVEDPMEYRHCGYAAALAGDVEARKGLQAVMGLPDWERTAAEYRMFLFTAAGTANHSEKRVLDREVIRAELARGGELGVGQVLRLRVRHLTDGLVLGSKEFVDAMHERYRERFGPRRKGGARPIRGVPLPGLRSLRDLRVDTVG